MSEGRSVAAPTATVNTPAAAPARMEVSGREVEPRELFWGSTIALGVAWFFLVRPHDPWLVLLAVPVELVGTYSLVRPHVQPPPGADESVDGDGR